MTFMRKIIDAFNMDNWHKEQIRLEDKGEKPKNLFWDEEPDSSAYSDGEYARQENNFFKKENTEKEKYKPYEYVLFSKSIDIPSIIGSRNDYMRRDYTIDPKYSEYWRYLHKLWKDSVDLEKIVKAKKFFEVLEEFENLIGDIEQYRFKDFIPEREKEYYSSKKDEILIKFLDRCFTDEYRNALELRTVSGRVNRIDHWFMMMDYYKYYLTPNSLTVLDTLNKRWTGELMPNLLENKN